MQPVLFGRSDRPLFGFFHPSESRTAAPPRGVVLAYPVGHEYYASYHAFRQLAHRLSRMGLPLLRFDYYGTGDSSGETGDGGLEQWCEDLRAAVDELRATTRVDSVDVAGLRLGAAIAALVANEERVDRLVLWEPVADGASYVRELREIQTRYVRNAFPRPDELAIDRDGIEAIGFPVSPALTASLETLDLYRLEAASKRVLVLGRDGDESSERLARHFQSLGSDASHRSLSGPRLWDWERRVDDSLVPLDALREICSFLS